MTIERAAVSVGVDHLLVRDADAARPVIEAAGAKVREEREVLVVLEAARSALIS